ncbi:hypothetical protein RRG08_060983 [Elysia crispata]|uniref:Uncharacterized protein n=1 Tax=Elysia crispata TaxID=231223 RepID=A0AAE1AUU0_9GAST|nr:hypothetical protein RRG08_060983 [Elysia crispata]
MWSLHQTFSLIMQESVGDSLTVVLRFELQMKYPNRSQSLYFNMRPSRPDAVDEQPELYDIGLTVFTYISPDTNNSLDKPSEMRRT